MMNQLPVDDVDWLFACAVNEPTHEDGTQGDFEIVLLRVDSGAFDHVCPKGFCSWIDIVPMHIDKEVIAADGAVMENHGDRKVTFGLVDGGVVRVCFQVMNVAKPILSVGKLVARGYLLCFGKQAFIMKGDRRCGLVKVGGLYYLPVRLKIPKAQRAITKEWAIDQMYWT